MVKGKVLDIYPDIINLRGVYIKLHLSGKKDNGILSFLEGLPLSAYPKDYYDTEVILMVKDGIKEMMKREGRKSKFTFPRPRTGWYNPKEYRQSGAFGGGIVPYLWFDEGFRKAWHESERFHLPCFINYRFGTVFQMFSPLRYLVYVYPLLSFSEVDKTFFMETILWAIYSHAMASLPKGIILHAAGVSKARRGCVFLAPSGGGKTTAVQIIDKYERGINILSDDQILLVKKDDSVYNILGILQSDSTKWRTIGKKNIELKALFFLRQASDTYVKMIKKVEALRKIFELTMPFCSDMGRRANKNRFYFLSHLVDQLPTYELGFKKDRNFWPFCESLIM